MRSPHARRRALALVAGAAGLLGLFASSGCRQSDRLPAEDPNRLKIELHSPAFANGEKIPRTFTCDGSDRSPPLEWSGVPAAAATLALICDDPDAPVGTWSHWVLFNIPPQLKELKEGVPAEQMVTISGSERLVPPGVDVPRAQQGKNDFGKTGYGGPCPPFGTHRYFFRMYALDTRLELSSSATRSEVLKAIDGHILAEGRLMGKYKRGG